MRILSLASIALLTAGWQACQPSRATTSGAAGGKACGLTVVYQNNNNGEIEPCG